MKLVDAVTVLRSKNAGPYHLTFDVFFRDAASFVAFTEKWSSRPECLGASLGVATEDVHFELLPTLSAVKVTVPRTNSAGSPTDADVLGCQQVALMMDMTL
jgi:hypothetical protein